MCSHAQIVVPSPTVRRAAIPFASMAVVFVLVALPWLAAWVLFASLGGWPLNDDPFYAKPLAFWAQDGRYQLVKQNGYLTASSVAHILVGGFAVTQGFHYRGLFLVCILQQALGAAALYWFSRRLQLSRTVGVLTAASLVTFPLYFGHGFTFMTDGPAAAWSSVACVCLTWGWLQRSAWFLALGALAIGWGYWIRQTNGALLIAPSILWFVSAWRDGQWRSTTLWPMAIALAMIVALESGWLLPASTARASDVAPDFAEGYIKRVLIAAYGWLLLIGWYFLPLAPWFATAAWRAGSEQNKWARAVCNSACGIVLLAGISPLLLTQGRAHLTNATGSFIQNGHFGPIFLSDMDEPGRWGTLAGVVWPEWFWQVLSVSAIASAAILSWWIVWAVHQSLPKRVAEAKNYLLCANAWIITVLVCVAAILLLIEPHMDRYWLFLMPVLSVVCLLLCAQQSWQLSRWSQGWAASIVTAQLIMSLIFVHDMLAWNNARWQFVTDYLAAGHTAASIDAGRDVNAWLRMDEDPDTSPRHGDESRWWSGHASLCISSGPRPGWQLHSQLPWTSWATGRTHYLLILERSSTGS